MIVYLNGKYLPIEDAKVSVLDRGFIFGDAVYEVWRLVGGKLFEADRHTRRVHNGLRDLAIAPPPEADVAKVREIAERLAKENGFTQEGSVFLEITRGAAPRTHHYPNPPVPPTVVFIASAFVPPEALRAKGASMILVDDLRWKRCNVKTTQLLPNVMARQEAVAGGSYDAGFVRDGIVTETAAANIFAVVDGVTYTHPVDGSVLPGITREVVLELAAAQGITVREEGLPVDRFRAAQEIFLCGTLTDVMPIVTLDGTPVGNGKPGPVATALFKALRERLDATARG